MRINNVSSNVYVYGQSKERQNPSVKELQHNSKDKIDISARGAEFQYALKAAKEARDFRPEKVAPIKEQVKNGTYHVSAENIAEKMIRDMTVQRV